MARLKRKGFEQNIHYAGFRMKLYKVYDERVQPAWSNIAQASIDAERRAGGHACVIHRGNLHGYYVEV